MTPWTSCRLYTPGATTPVRVGASGRLAARMPLLVSWAEGDRRRVVRVVDERGDDLAPADVDWSGIPGGEPERRVGPPVTSGRSVEGARQVLVRLSAEEHAACEAQAERAGMSLAAWLRGLGMSAALGGLLRVASLEPIEPLLVRINALDDAADRRSDRCDFPQRGTGQSEQPNGDGGDDLRHG